MAWKECFMGKPKTFFVKRYNSDAMSGQITIDRDGTFEIWTCLEKSYYNTYNFKLNNTSITSTLSANTLATQNATNGFGFSSTWITASKGDIFSWSVSYANRTFVMFNR